VQHQKLAYPSVASACSGGRWDREDSTWSALFKIGNGRSNGPTRRRSSRPAECDSPAKLVGLHSSRAGPGGRFPPAPYEGFGQARRIAFPDRRKTMRRTTAACAVSRRQNSRIPPSAKSSPCRSGRGQRCVRCLPVPQLARRRFDAFGRFIARVLSRLDHLINNETRHPIDEIGQGLTEIGPDKIRHDMGIEGTRGGDGVRKHTRIALSTSDRARALWRYSWFVSMVRLVDHTA